MHMQILAAVVAALLPTVRAQAPSPEQYWNVSPPIDYTDELYAGFPQLKVDAEALVYKGTEVNRTYAHHPELYHDGNRTYLMYSTAPIDEDSTGQDAWLSTSTDGGFTWSKGFSILPDALLPNQSHPANYTYWCNNRIWQRAHHPVAWVPVNKNTLYAVSQTTLRFCWSDADKGTKAAGRIARVIDKTGAPVGDPCWTSQNNWTEVVRFNETVYGKYGMKLCRHAAQIEAYLKEPVHTPAWGTWLYQTPLFAADNIHDMQEPTHAVWRGSPKKGYWERFWRDISNSSTISHAVWVERTRSPSGRSWYPAVEAQHGNAIFRTDIPDVGSKQHHGVLPGDVRYLVHNPRNNTARLRQPLTIATGRGEGGFTGVGVLRTNASSLIAPDTRGLKRLMFSYPTAVMVRGKLVVAYSENKENIWVSVVDPKNLR
ncbi:hypothetical protein C7974DRAFT_403308 [Boeremia exigua]|uniref:uncharacterized protein n=1 Tax=Boeremia exigua TaxID=749465 RepID=UPI001E8E1664|nr:uncharacterized protein C7974DRAFT_403308 [Boeremia exigua]KAH6615111.1 hypothetical protein C7974DRAFT_403308 [Boeremia exigua]